MTDVRGSFRDPSGSLFVQDGVLYRRIHPSYRAHFEHAERSGLLSELIRSELLVPHDDVDGLSLDADTYKVIRPKRIPFVSYPYEWCFSQLKDAALLTLEIQKRALEHGMILKDASAFNVQFLNGKPIFIDTLSFETYEEGAPWIGYRQFCQHFLAPLSLMSRADVRLNRLFQTYLDGIPLDLASALLPKRTYMNLYLLSHIHLHAKGQKRFESNAAPKQYRISRHNLLGLIDSLESGIKRLSMRESNTEWGDYYEHTNYSGDALQRKGQIVREFLEHIKPKTLWDLGANTGEFSRIASARGIDTLAFDIDPMAVEQNYRTVRAKHEEHLLPLLMDLTNPTPPLGWSNEERMSLSERGPANAALALALVHHLAISNNVPLERIAEYFSGLCHDLIIEFVPKSDSQVQKLLATRTDIFPNYTEEGFERAFGAYFVITKKRDIAGSQRLLYHMTKK